MAEYDSRPEVSISKGLRQLRRDLRSTRRVLPGCLILTAQEPQPETAGPEIVVALRKACKKLFPASSGRLRCLFR